MQPEIEFAYEKEIKQINFNTNILCALGLIIFLSIFFFAQRIGVINENLNTIKTLLEGEHKHLSNTIDSIHDLTIKEIKKSNSDIEKIKWTVESLEEELIIKKQFTELCKAPVNQKHFGSTENCIDYMSR